MKLVAVALGFIFAAIGTTIIAAPSASLEFGRSILSPNVLYIAAAVRVFAGAALVWVAPVSRAPKTLRILGVLIVLAGVATPFVGVERSRTMLDWSLAQGPLFTRAWAGVAVVLGLFIVYAITTPRRSAA